MVERVKYSLEVRKLNRNKDFVELDKLTEREWAIISHFIDVVTDSDVVPDYKHSIGGRLEAKGG